MFHLHLQIRRISLALFSSSYSLMKSSYKARPYRLTLQIKTLLNLSLRSSLHTMKIRSQISVCIGLKVLLTIQRCFHSLRSVKSVRRNQSEARNCRVSVKSAKTLFWVRASKTNSRYHASTSTLKWNDHWFWKSSTKRFSV